MSAFFLVLVRWLTAIMDGLLRVVKKKAFVLGLALFLLAGTLGVAFGDNLEQQLNTTREQLDQKKGEADQTRGVVTDYSQQISSLNKSINDKTIRIKDLETELGQCRDHLSMTEAELKEALEKLEKSTEALNKRVRHIYEAGNVSYLEVLFEANDFSDFVNRLELLKRVVQQDASIVEEVKADRQRLENKKADLQAQQDRFASLIAEQEAARKLRSKRSCGRSPAAILVTTGRLLQGDLSGRCRDTRIFPRILAPACTPFMERAGCITALTSRRTPEPPWWPPRTERLSTSVI